MKNSPRTFRDAFLEAKEEQSLTFEQIATGAGVSVEMLKKLSQKQDRKINVEDARDVAHFFGMKLDEFIDDPKVSAHVELSEILHSVKPKDIEVVKATLKSVLAALEKSDDQAKTE